MKLPLTIYDMHIVVPLNSSFTHLDTTGCLFMHNIPLTIHHLHMKISLIDYHMYTKVPLTLLHLNT